MDPKGAVVDTFEMGAGSLSRSDVVIKKGGIHTLRAVVTDEANQVSTNACEAQVDVKGGFPIFVGGYFGKERLTHDDAADHDDITPFAAFSRCAPLAGFEIGVQPKIGDNAEFEAAVGVKFPFEDDAHTNLFVDAAVNRLAQPRLLRRRRLGVGHREGLERRRPPAPGRLRPRQGRQVADRRPDARAVLQPVRQHREQLPVLGRHPLPALQLEVAA